MLTSGLKTKGQCQYAIATIQKVLTLPPKLKTHKLVTFQSLAFCLWYSDWMPSQVDGYHCFIAKFYSLFVIDSGYWFEGRYTS